LSEPATEVLTTDVLIIGGGAGALRASVAAAEREVDVTLVCKGKVANSGATPWCDRSSSYEFCGIGASLGDDEGFFSDLNSVNAGLNIQYLTRAVAYSSTETIRCLDKLGVRFEKYPDGRFVQVREAGYSCPRLVYSRWGVGTEVVRALKQEAKRLDVNLMDWIYTLGLLTKGRSVVGALVFNLKKGTTLVIQSKATVMATGGVGCLIMPTLYPQDVSGDGLAMAYKAGAELMNMEFIYSIPLAVYPTYGLGLLTPALVSGTFTNSRGEEFPAPEFPPITFSKNYLGIPPDPSEEELWIPALTFYGKLTPWISAQIRNGLTGPHRGVFWRLDTKRMPVETFAKRYPSSYRRLLSLGVDLSKDSLEFAPFGHYLMGGIRINEKCESSLSGLYAAGEVSAGVFGASRLLGAGIIEALTTGKIGGENAAEYAKGFASCLQPDQKNIESEKRRISELYKRRSGVGFEKVREELHKVLYTIFAIKDQASLNEALKKLQALKVEINEIYVPTNAFPSQRMREMTKVFETENMVLVGEMYARASLCRTESRGHHRRTDYPKSSPEWLRNIIITNDDRTMKVAVGPKL
jgi:succinate dehydrogenase/fumarate reductase flavoprotein subunit